jgi:hypothetical protein
MSIEQGDISLGRDEIFFSEAGQRAPGPEQNPSRRRLGPFLNPKPRLRRIHPPPPLPVPFPPASPRRASSQVPISPPAGTDPPSLSFLCPGESGDPVCFRLNCVSFCTSTEGKFGSMGCSYAIPAAPRSFVGWRRSSVCLLYIYIISVVKSFRWCRVGVDGMDCRVTRVP